MLSTHHCSDDFGSIDGLYCIQNLVVNFEQSGTSVTFSYGAMHRFCHADNNVDFVMPLHLLVNCTHYLDTQNIPNYVFHVGIKWKIESRRTVQRT